MAIRRMKSDKLRGLRGLTDWEKVRSMDDAAIRASAALDPDARELRPDELIRFRRVSKP